MSEDQGPPQPVIRLSLLENAERYDDDERLATAVGALLAPHGVTAPGAYRFLVVDTPEGLVRHQPVYERLLRYQRSPRISLLCLLTGDLRLGAAGGDATSVLRLPGMLRTTSVGVLWAGDPKAGGGLAALAGLLQVPELFDHVLQRLSATCNGVAAPGARLLEYDLSAAARDRAWESGAARFVGRPSGGGPSGSDSPSGLPDPLDRLADAHAADGSAAYTRGGPLEDDRARCVAALRAAAEAKRQLETMGGLVAGQGSYEFGLALDEARAALSAYRGQVSAVTELGAHPAGAVEPAEAALRLKELGVTLRPSGVTPEQSGEGLRALAERLFGAGLTLSGVADRFEDCSARMMPYQDEALADEPDRVCPPGLLRPGGGGTPPEPGGAAGARVLGFLAGALAGAGVLPWSAGAIGVVLLTLLGALLVSRHLPAGAPRVRGAFEGRYAVAQAASATLGGALAVTLGTVLGLPSWTAPVGLPVGLLLAWLAVVREWNRAVGQVWRDSGAAALQAAVRALDDVLDQAVRRRWWAEPERVGSAEAARSVSVVLGTVGAAVTAEAAAGVHAEEPPVTGPVATADPEAGEDDGGPDVPDWMPRTSGPVPPVRSTAAPEELTPLWMDRENGDGGPDLVATLSGDFADLVVRALEPYWESVKRGHAAAGAEHQAARRVRELMDVARRHLLHNGVIPAPRFADPKRSRGGPAGLIGLGLDRVVEVAGPNADREPVVQLASTRQLPLLSRDPVAVEWIRFAPAALRSQMEGRAIDGESFEDGAVWTYSGRYAGQLRLTPLRSGSVESVRTYGDPLDPYPRDSSAVGPADPAGAARSGPNADDGFAPDPEGAGPNPWKDPVDEEHSW